MYAGEVNISQEQLPAFLKTADRLKVNILYFMKFLGNQVVYKITKKYIFN